MTTYTGVEAHLAGCDPDSVELTREELRRAEEGDFISQAAADIAGEWLATTAEGQEFAQRYNSKENRDALDEAMAALGSGLSVESLTKFYNDLKGSGRLKRVYTPEERQRAERESRLAGYRRFYQSATTVEIKAEEARDPEGFGEWLRGRVAREIAPPPEQGPPAPVETFSRQAAHLTRLGMIPLRVRQFAEEYGRLSAAEAKRRMATEPDFSAAVEEASSFGIL